MCYRHRLILPFEKHSYPPRLFFRYSIFGKQCQIRFIRSFDDISLSEYFFNESSEFYHAYKYPSCQLNLEDIIRVVQRDKVDVLNGGTCFPQTAVLTGGQRCPNLLWRSEEGRPPRICGLGDDNPLGTFNHRKICHLTPMFYFNVRQCS